jgi:hypothetical protein
MIIVIGGLDLGFRPRSYFWPLNLETHLRATVRGRERRAELEQYIADGRLAEAPDYFIKDRLTPEERSAQSRIHPHMMGGEYLGERLEDEIEIARISIESATHDVTSMYARQADGKIHYRVVDEYEGATLTQLTRGTSVNPLTLEQLGRRFLQAWPLLDIIEMNFGYCDLATALKFARGESAFYPQFGAYIEKAITDWVQKHREEDEESEEAGVGA